jgi:hypothetical protein
MAEQQQDKQLQPCCSSSNIMPEAPDAWLAKHAA